MTVKKWKVKGRNRHPFRFAFDIPGVKKRVSTALADTFYAQRGGVLTVTEKHVQQALDAKGWGDTRLCTGAFCTRDPATKEQLRDAIPAHILNREDFASMIDWTDSRAYISIRDGESGAPIECMVFGHDGDHISLINDTGEAGMRKLLAYVKKHGPIEIPLYKVESAEPRPGRKRGKNDGSRSGGSSGKNGAWRRLARVPVTPMHVHRDTPDTV